MSGLIGKKLGMTRIYDEQGKALPVTVVEVGPCVVLYSNDKKVQLGYEELLEKKTKKPQLGFYKKIKQTPKKYVKQLDFADLDQEFKIGDVLKADIFKEGDMVKVTGISKGKGFQGGVKRWNWKGGPKTHGSMSHRRPGSIGASATPSRVVKGHHMPGHMGNVKTTVKNIKVLKVDAEDGVLVLKGAVPGVKNSIVFVNKIIKK